MYRKILVPLDGSELAECALPHVRSLAKEGSVEGVVLLRAVEAQMPLAYTSTDDFEIAPNFDFQAFWEEEAEKAQKYLDDVQSRLRLEGIKVWTAVIKGAKAAEIIVDYARKNEIEMIIMATHGYTGMKKLVFGSVAFRVLQESPVPVFLIRPESCQS